MVGWRAVRPGGHGRPRIAGNGSPSGSGTSIRASGRSEGSTEDGPPASRRRRVASGASSGRGAPRQGDPPGLSCSDHPPKHPARHRATCSSGQHGIHAAAIRPMPGRGFGPRPGREEARSRNPNCPPTRGSASSGVLQCQEHRIAEWTIETVTQASGKPDIAPTLWEAPARVTTPLPRGSATRMGGLSDG